jgi:ubiquitin-small subunit ribosomal protein S27Ae
MAEGKKERKNHIPSEVWKKYEVKDDKISRKPYCPRCGPGYFLAQHKDRTYCGKCSYVEMKSKPAEAPKKPAEAPKKEEKKE